MKNKILRSVFQILLSCSIAAAAVLPLAASAENAIEIRVSLINTVEYTSSTPCPSEQDRKAATEALRRITQTAYDAFIMDHPKRSMWIDINKTKIEAVSSSRLDGGVYIWSVSALINRISALPEYEDPERMTAELEAAVDAFTPVGDTLYDRILSIHDYICLLNEYDATGKYAYSAYGALVDRKSVCEGYAEAFRLICERNGIECILVSGKGLVLRNNAEGQLTEYSENHMWNYVRMDDGKWYAVDATWDDGRIISHEFLLVGADTVVNPATGRRFSQNHIPSGDISGTGLFEFRLPELSQLSYKDNNPPVTESSDTSDIPASSGDTSGLPTESGSGAESETKPEAAPPLTDAPESDEIQAPHRAREADHRNVSGTYYYAQLNDEQKNFYDALMKVEPPSDSGGATTSDRPVTVTTETDPVTDPPRITTSPITRPPSHETTETTHTDTGVTSTEAPKTDTTTDTSKPKPGSDSFTIPLVSIVTGDDTTGLPPSAEPTITLRYVVHVTVIVLAIGSLFCIIGILILKFQHREKK